MIGTSALIGAVIGAAGTAVGGVLALLFGKRIGLTRPLMAFAGGLMISVVLFDMLSESAHVGGILVMSGGAAAGGICFALLGILISRENHHSLAATGWMVLAGIALHNFPEGLAVGSSLVQSESLAFSLALLMMVHNVPEGMAFCLPLRASGISGPKILGLAALTGLPTALGAIVGNVAGTVSAGMIAFCIAFAGGAMLYLSLAELIPASGRDRSGYKNNALSALLGLAVGFCLTTWISL